MIGGKVTISRRSNCKGDGKVVITIEDRASGITIVEAHMEFSEFAECITGMSYCDTDLTVASAVGHSYIGMKRVTETLDIPVSSNLSKSEESRQIIENSVPDGWMLWSDGLNSQQRKKRGSSVRCLQICGGARIMSYTQERLKGMSDLEIEMALAKSLDLRNVHERGGMACYQMQFGGSKAVQYCADWSVTGPLMIEYGISLIFEPDEDGNVVVVEHKPSGIWSDNPSPLRSVCEVILMMDAS